MEREIYFIGREGNTHKNRYPSGSNVYNEHFQNTEADMRGYQFCFGTVLVGSIAGGEEGSLDELE